MQRISQSPLLPLLAVVLLPTSTAWADLIVSFAPVQMSANSNQFVDVFVRSEPGTTVDVAGYDLNFLISDTNEVTASGTMQFSDPQTSDPTSDGRYVFAGTTTSNFVANRREVQELNVADSTRTGFGMFVNFTDFEVAESRRLLGRLEISQNQGLDVQVERGKYTIMIDEASSFFHNASNSDSVSGALPFTQNAGTVTVGVPEPGASALIVIAIGLLHIRRRV